jgi:hypothetical protein
MSHGAVFAKTARFRERLDFNETSYTIGARTRRKLCLREGVSQMAIKLKRYDYVSRAKVAQLYDQLHEFSVSEQSVRKDRTGGGSVETRAGIQGLFGGSVKGDVNVGQSIEQKGSVTTMQKLAEVLTHIEKHESVGDLNDIMTAETMRLDDSFCYTYRGRFAVLGVLPRRPGRFYGNPNVYDSAAIRINERAYDEIAPAPFNSIEPLRFILTDQFEQPAHAENNFEEIDKDGAYLVSDICILGSITGHRLLQLACSFKYFNTMMNEGWERDQNEHYFQPDSSSALFFHGYHTFTYEGIIFVTGVDGLTVMGSPLTLHS